MGTDKDAVRAKLSIPELLNAYGYEATSEKNDRFNDCPSCGSGCRGKFKTTEDVCVCHACGFTGDLFSVGGAILDLNPDVHFHKIVDACALVAGVSGEYDDSSLEAFRESKRSRQKTEADLRTKERERAERGAAEVWHRLEQRHFKGQEYVASRGIMPTKAADGCRYTSKSVCLPIWRDGEIVNIVGRRFEGGNPKIRGLDRCGTRGTFGKPVLKSWHVGPIVVVEGFFDYLSARQMSPTRLVLGAHGCNNLGYVAEVAAELVAGSATGLVLIPHRDSAGESAMAKAMEAAEAGGVSPAAMTVFELSQGCNDLNDHLCARGRVVP